MDFQQLKSFIHVAKCGSITKASDLLFISVSALKQQMDSLETEIGVTLFNRSPKGMSLTPAGEYFYEKCEELTTQLNDILWETRNIETDNSTTVYVGFRHMKIADYLYPEFLMAFLKENPEANVMLVDMNENSYSNVDLLICDYLGNAEFEQAYHLRDMPVQCIMNASHPLSQRSEITIEDLQSYNLIVYPMTVLSCLTPALAKALQDKKLSYQETLLNRDVIYMNLIPTDSILLTFGDEKYLNNVLTQIPLKGYSVDYSIHSRKNIRKPIAKKFLDFMVQFYSEHK